MRTHDIIVQEEIFHVALNDLLEKDHTVLSILTLRQLHDARKHRRNLNHRKFEIFLLLIALLLNESRNV